MFTLLMMYCTCQLVMIQAVRQLLILDRAPAFWGGNWIRDKNKACSCPMVAQGLLLLHPPLGALCGFLRVFNVVDFS